MFECWIKDFFYDIDVCEIKLIKKENFKIENICIFIFEYFIDIKRVLVNVI